MAEIELTRREKMELKLGRGFDYVKATMAMYECDDNDLLPMDGVVLEISEEI